MATTGNKTKTAQTPVTLVCVYNKTKSAFDLVFNYKGTKYFFDKTHPSVTLTAPSQIAAFLKSGWFELKKEKVK